MSEFEVKSRKLARESYWRRRDRDAYECPDCGRTEDEIEGSFEVHHKNGEPMDNRPENQVGLCPLCHYLREDKKPPLKLVRGLQSQSHDNSDGDLDAECGSLNTCAAGPMDSESPEPETTLPQTDGQTTEMHRDVSWMVPSDRPILRELADVGGRWQKPATIALNLPYARYTISERLRLLAEKGLVERKSDDTPAYRITDLGRMFLADDLSASELEDL